MNLVQARSITRVIATEMELPNDFLLPNDPLHLALIYGYNDFAWLGLASSLRLEIGADYRDEELVRLATDETMTVESFVRDAIERSAHLPDAYCFMKALLEQEQLHGPLELRRLSSVNMTLWAKTVFPIIWFGFIGLMTLCTIIAMIATQRLIWQVLILPGMALPVYVFMRWWTFPMLDEVLIEGDHIIVKNNSQKDCFSIANVIDASASWFMNPERVALTLKEPCRFGRKIVFSPTFRWLSGGPHPIAAQLMRRVRLMTDRG